MGNYILLRLFGIIPLLLGISIITFSVIHLAPGKPTDLQTQLNPKISQQTRERLEKLYGLDKPLHVQYIAWLKKIIRLDFGTSFTDGRSVRLKILETLPITLIINVLSIIFILLIAIPVGIASATKQHSWFDRFSTVFVFVGFSMPSFWLALLLIIFFSIKLGWLPISGLHSLNYDQMSYFQRLTDFGRHLVMPVFIGAFGGIAGMSRYMRSNMLEVLNQDYIRTARAKGLSEFRVVYKHALKNAVIPLITILGLSVPGLIGGSVIIESIFAIPGMGRLFFQSAMSRDYPVIMGILTMGAVLTLIGNLFADICYGIADPRIKYEKN
ncbi:MAG: ABC transporter permease [bacterium]|nr:ABC transporter permease [bacterium]